MMPKIKNIIIFVGIALVLILIYVFFIKGDPETATLISSDGSPATDTGVAAPGTPQISQDFLNTLLSIKNIKLDDTILSDQAFLSLHDSSIILLPDQEIGRPNPFAPIGSNNVGEPTSPVVPTTTTTTTTTTPTNSATPPASSNPAATTNNSNTPITNPAPNSGGTGAGASTN